MLLNKRDLVALGAGQENKKPKERNYDDLIRKQDEKKKMQRKAEKKAAQLAEEKERTRPKTGKKRTDSEEAIRAEMRENKRKNAEHKKVRESKMMGWNGEKAALVDAGAVCKKDDEKAGVLIFKIKHAPRREPTVRDVLRIAAKKACHKRNRSLDDEFVLFGDRCANDNPYIEQESSEEDSDLPMSEMADVLKQNAADLHE